MSAEAAATERKGEGKIWREHVLLAGWRCKEHCGLDGVGAVCSGDRGIRWKEGERKREGG
jgi:hypothetical protein